MNNKRYYIEFKTNEMPGRIVATSVKLESKILSRDPAKTYAVNLCDDPLYPYLEHYVLNNPSKKG